MMDDLPKAYAAYQQALYHLPNPKVFIYDYIMTFTFVSYDF
jgi:hypothetical protein